ncbi:hypothetical protein ACIQYQ_09725 [Pseudomonas asiatica]|uniref:hypothetical protein n=1 Tax=Pseudomonas asiatica TaxID=2219225 RepID=UPI00383BE351
MTRQELRDDIIAYMSKPELSSRGWYCTRWFRHHIQHGAIGTRRIRQELDRMEKMVLVVSDKAMSNNTLWQLAPQKVTP